MRLAGKTVIVTGAWSGMGRATAGLFACQGKPSGHLPGMSDLIDLAHAVLYLASDQSRATAGHVLKVDSGMSIS